MNHLIFIIFVLFNWAGITYGQGVLSEREFKIVNDTDLTFYLHPNAFEGAYYSAFPLDLHPSSEILFSLKVITLISQLMEL